MSRIVRFTGGAIAAVALLVQPGVAQGHPGQHGDDEGHLVGGGEFGVIELLRVVELRSPRTGERMDDLIADVAVDPQGEYAYLAHWGEPDCDANGESGGRTSPDAGVFVVDINPIEDAHQVGFIAASLDSRPGEGVQVVHLTTPRFTGDVLVTNNERCGRQGRGGVSLFDVTDPHRPMRLSTHFGDRGTAGVNDIHSSFAWDAGDRAYLVMTDNFEASDVDILDITNPRRPRLIGDFDLNAVGRALGDPIDQPELGLDESFLHDMIVTNIDGDFIMLLSYWDGGYIQLDVDDPTDPVLLRDTDYAAVDPELADPANASVPAASRDLPPEGNAHQNEFTSDHEMFIGTDEDFSPYRPRFTVTSGSHAGEYPAGEFGWTVPIDSLPGQSVSGTTVFLGYACPESGPLPAAETTGIPDGQQVAVISRGPVEDPSANYEACFFSQKVEAAQNAGYDAVVIGNHHVGAQQGEAADAKFCGGQGHAFTPTVPAMCIGHRAMHLLFESTPAYGVPVNPSAEPAIGTIGAAIGVTTEFDGWGYVHLFDRQTAQELDTFAIDEAMDPAMAHGFGDLSVHEVATDPVDARRAYLSYYSGGLRALDIVCADPSDESTCRLEEVGGYLDPAGNDFWGVEAFRRAGSDTTFILASDRDSGLWIFRRSG